MVTRPSTQAGHWFSEALLKAIMLLDSHPDYESLMVLPDFPGPRQAHRTQTGRASSAEPGLFVAGGGDVRSDTWAA